MNPTKHIDRDNDSRTHKAFEAPLVEAECVGIELRDGPTEDAEIVKDSAGSIGGQGSPDRHSTADSLHSEGEQASAEGAGFHERSAPSPIPIATNLRSVLETRIKRPNCFALQEDWPTTHVFTGFIPSESRSGGTLWFGFGPQTNLPTYKARFTSTNLQRELELLAAADDSTETLRKLDHYYETEPRLGRAYDDESGRYGKLDLGGIVVEPGYGSQTARERRELHNELFPKPQLSPTELRSLIKQRIGNPLLLRMEATLRPGRNYDHEAKAKLNELLVQLHLAGLSDKLLASVFGCNRSTIWRRRANCNTAAVSSKGERLRGSVCGADRALPPAERKFLNAGLRAIGYHKSEYQKYINSPYWQRVCHLYDQSDRNQGCVVCGSMQNRDHHHKTYMHLAEQHNHLDDLEILCHDHHSDLHNRTLDLRKGIDILKREHKKLLATQLEQLKQQGQKQYTDIRAKLDLLIELNGGDPVKSAEKILAAHLDEVDFEEAA